MSVSAYWPLYMMCIFVFMCVCDIRVAVKKVYYVLEQSKFNTLLDKTHNKVLLVLRYQGSTCKVK